MESVVVWFIFIITMFTLTIVYADYQVDALYAFKQNISEDPNNVMQSWDATLTKPCTWFHITCDEDDYVTRIDLGDAGLSGQLAPELGNLAHLQYLNLFNNNLSGQIPEEIGSLSNLISLDLYNNSLSGPIPGSLGKLANLMKLVLYENNLDGQIPEEIGGLSNLFTLDLYDNSLSGPIPGSLGNLVKLKNLRIQNNNLTGPVPLGFPCLNLDDANVAGNDLCGPFTAWCIDSNDPRKCTNDLHCPCRCGQDYNTPCDLLKTPLDNGRCCLKPPT